MSSSHKYILSRDHITTAAITFYHDPVILRNKLTPLSISRGLALRKRDSKKFMIYFYVFYRVVYLHSKMIWVGSLSIRGF